MVIAAKQPGIDSSLQSYKGTLVDDSGDQINVQFPSGSQAWNRIKDGTLRAYDKVVLKAYNMTKLEL